MKRGGDEKDSDAETPDRVYVATPKELKIFRECLYEAFWFRSLPMASIAGFSVFFLVKKGHLKPGKFGPWGKMVAAISIAYCFGKITYILGDHCKNKFLREAPNGAIAYHIRKSRGLSQPWQAEQNFGNAEPVTTIIRENDSMEMSLLEFVTNSTLNDQERDVLTECNRCAFYSYSLPISFAISLGIYGLQSKGYLSSSKFFQNPWLAKAPKIIVGIALGYTYGQIMYWKSTDCSERFLSQLPESQETRVTTLRDILQIGVKDGKLNSSQLEFLDRQYQSH